MGSFHMGPSLPCLASYIPTSVSWDHLPSKLLALKDYLGVCFLGESNLRHCSTDMLVKYLVEFTH